MHLESSGCMGMGPADMKQFFFKVNKHQVEELGAHTSTPLLKKISFLKVFFLMECVIFIHL